MHRALVAAWIIAACGGPQPPRTEPPRNIAPMGTLTIPRTQSLGWLGLAPSPTGDSELSAYIPTHATYPLVVAPPLTAVPETRVSAIGTTGTVATYTVAPPAQLLYGCDGNSLEVTPFIGRRMAPGAVWILPLDPPRAWQPQALQLRVLESAPERARIAFGPLAVELTRRTPSTGTLTITREGRTIHSEPFERVVMDGAPPDAATIDLTELDSPGVPSPIAAWSIVAGGPILVALHTPGWEGSNLSALLVEDEHTRTVDSMAHYLYRCAF